MPRNDTIIRFEFNYQNETSFRFEIIPIYFG